MSNNNPSFSGEIKTPIVFAADLPQCDCCEEPWCPMHLCHYADCPCLGIMSAEEEGYEIVQEGDKFFGVKKVRVDSLPLG